MKRKLYLVVPISLVLGFTLTPSVSAAVKPHALFSENMVLQQGIKVPVWGSANDGEQVTVTIQGQEISTTAKDGKWKVELASLKAGGPFEMEIKGSNSIKYKNVLVGEVWVASGQSNMEWPVSLCSDPKKTIEESANPRIRLFTVPKLPTSGPVSNINSSWHECNPKTIPSFSAVAYFFGRDLERTLKVPIGLINTSWGGTPAESWTSKACLESEPSLKYLAEKHTSAMKEYAASIDRYIAELEKYKQSVLSGAEEGKNLPTPPAPGTNPARNAWTPSTLYNGMIAPLIPYAIRGAIWYQGESNAGRAFEYRTLMPTMIKNWRKDWNQGEFPFFMVQLAPFMKIEAEPKDSEWAELREAQLLTTLNLPNTGEAVITDVGHETDIHPRWKDVVGARLALAARAMAYGEKIVYSGPVYKSVKFDGSKAILSFDHVGGGMVSKGGPLVGFTIAGEDRKFFKADAEIQDDKIVVSCSKVEKPVAVRFGWANYPVVNLWNKDGLPATPFRTYDFQMLTNKTKPTSADSAR
jgi:sialate O-acetylesterase